MVRWGPVANSLPSSLLAPPLRASRPSHLPCLRSDLNHRLQHLLLRLDYLCEEIVWGLRGTGYLGSLPSKRAGLPFGRRLLRDHPCSNSVRALVHVHLRFALSLLDQFYNLLGDWIGSGDDPILTFAKEDYITLVFGQLRYSGQWAAHFAHLSQALV